MKITKIIAVFAIGIALISCEKSSDVTDAVKKSLGLEEKFAVTLNDEEWTSDIRIVKEIETPNAFNIVGSSVGDGAIQISIMGVEEGTYYVSLAESLKELELKFCIASYFEDLGEIDIEELAEMTDFSGLNDRYKAVSGSVEITDVQTEAGSKFISGTFDVTFAHGTDTIVTSDGFFTELKVLPV